MKTIAWLLLAAAVLLAVALAAGRAWLRLEWIQLQVRRKFPEVAQMSGEELARRLAAGEPIVVADVRSAEEFAVSHLPGARLVDPRSEDPLAEVGKGAVVVSYCSVGWRSSQLAERLAAAGYRHVFNLEGSIFKWTREGRPLVQSTPAGERPVARVHPYSPAWSFLVPPAQRAYLPEEAIDVLPNP